MHRPASPASLRGPLMDISLRGLPDWMRRHTPIVPHRVISIYGDRLVEFHIPWVCGKGLRGNPFRSTFSPSAFGKRLLQHSLRAFSPLGVYLGLLPLALGDCRPIPLLRGYMAPIAGRCHF